jgi:hypothetical protein
MTDQTKWGIPELQMENKARRHEKLKRERQAVYDSCDLDVQVKDIMIDIATKQSTHKLRDVIREFFSNK